MFFSLPLIRNLFYRKNKPTNQNLKLGQKKTGQGPPAAAEQGWRGSSRLGLQPLKSCVHERKRRVGEVETWLAESRRVEQRADSILVRGTETDPRAGGRRTNCVQRKLPGAQLCRDTAAWRLGVTSEGDVGG